MEEEEKCVMASLKCVMASSKSFEAKAALPAAFEEAHCGLGSSRRLKELMR